MSEIDDLILNSDSNTLDRLVASGKISKELFLKKNIKEELPLSLYISESKIHNKGVFTKNHINANRVIETCDMIELEFRDKYHKDQVILDYAYAISDQADESKIHGNRLFLLTGFGLMYNHSDSFNAQWSFDMHNMKVVLRSVRYIDANEEITIFYGQGYWNRKSMSSDNKYKIIDLNKIS